MLRYLLLMTRIFAFASLGVLIFGIILGQQQKELSKAWLTVSMTLFVVALVLLVLIMRDQRRAVAALKYWPASGRSRRRSPAGGGNPERRRAGTEEERPAPAAGGHAGCPGDGRRGRTSPTWNAAASPPWAAWSA